MRKAAVCIVSIWCMGVMAAQAGGQTTRKPGLWEIDSKMTWQLSPIPPGVQLPGGISPSTPTSHTTPVCLTQERIDKYGAPIPQSRKECHAENVKKSASGMSADWVCDGRMKGKGTLESSWTDDAHAQGKIHFLGTMQMSTGEEPIEWTNESSSAYKGADCGDVKPVPLSQPVNQKPPGK